MPIITVDLDLDEVRHEQGDEARPRTSLETLICLLRLSYICSNRRCYVCRTRKGIHIYIYTESYDIEKVVALRSYLCDDDIRIDIDIARARHGKVSYIDTLFKVKLTKNGISKERCVDAKTFLEELRRRL